MTTHIYTAEEITELTTLADEARALDAERRAVWAEIGAAIDRVAGFDFVNWCGPDAGETVRTVDPRWLEYPELAHIAALDGAMELPNLQHMPQFAGQMAYKHIQRPADWRKLNNRCRKEIAKARKALEAK
jgi:hypothetical protein